MENKINACICAGFTLTLAAALAVNGILSLLGETRFAYWHLYTLAISLLLSGMEPIHPETKAQVYIIYARLKKRLHHTIVVLFRAVRSLPALLKTRINRKYGNLLSRPQAD